MQAFKKNHVLKNIHDKQTNLQSTKHQSLETNLLDTEEDDTYAGELKLVEGNEALVGDTLLGLALLELVCELRLANVAEL